MVSGGFPIAGEIDTITAASGRACPEQHDGRVRRALPNFIMTRDFSHTALLWIVAAAFFMQALDTTIVNTALPSMAQSLQIGRAHV